MISGKTNARRPCGGRKRSTSKQTDDYICLTVKKIHDMPLRTIQQQHLPNISLPIINKRLKSFDFVSEKPIEKPYLNARHRHLRLQFAKELRIGPCLFGDPYASLMSLYSRTSDLWTSVPQIVYEKPP